MNEKFFEFYLDYLLLNPYTKDNKDLELINLSCLWRFAFFEALDNKSFGSVSNSFISNVESMKAVERGYKAGELVKFLENKEHILNYFKSQKRNVSDLAVSSLYVLCKTLTTPIYNISDFVIDNVSVLDSDYSVIIPCQPLNGSSCQRLLDLSNKEQLSIRIQGYQNKMNNWIEIIFWNK